MSDHFEKEEIEKLINNATQDIDTIELPRDTENLLVASLEQQIGTRSES